MKRLLFIPDVHSPYHDQKAWHLALKCIEHWNPERLIVLGDFLDCYSISRHSKDPGRKTSLMEEIGQGSVLLDQIEKAAGPKCLKTYIMGNHEHRLARYVSDTSPELHGILDIRDLLSLPDRGWDTVPYLRGIRLGSLYVTHDVGNAGINAHRQARDVVGRGVVIGHTHLMAMDFRESVGRKGVAPAAMFGTLASRPTIEYAHEAKTALWTLGLGVGILMPGGRVHLQAVPFMPAGNRLEAFLGGDIVKS